MKWCPICHCSNMCAIFRAVFSELPLPLADGPQFQPEVLVQYCKQKSQSLADI